MNDHIYSMYICLVFHIFHLFYVISTKASRQCYDVTTYKAIILQIPEADVLFTMQTCINT